MPAAMECVCVFCGATMHSRRGLCIHVRKRHAQPDALPDALPDVRAQRPSAAPALQLASDDARLGSGPQSGRIVALQAPVFLIQTPRALCAPVAHLPAVLDFEQQDARGKSALAHAVDTSGDALARMRLAFLLNPV